MRGITWLRALILLCTITILLVGCGSSDPSWESFEGAANEKSFPVPKEANQKAQPASNTEMDVVTYSLPGLKKDDIFPIVYLEAIREWGWQEEQENQQDADRVFIKNNKMVQVTIHDGYLVIMMPKANDKSLMKSLEIK
ncbi:hypothetical protein [Paenibacillus crassostreae]|uniref:Lipoprotein n=1 Tax=Paenibacillus crassostreae TaxID=1763538 RepID=A0A162N7L0_9BACL|nr:hypothetical protein [Paenibacillus crassostreae]AOZ92844.1 hypothetical protein LPB68_11895 [Paenibacillus crassostreae]OAB71202.1 hypothetical protein PNBC_20595 [Paenibacillus crassostreae]